jgi:hypothetical protein
LAASGEAWIAFLSTVRHPEIITHWKNGGEFGWRMNDFAKGGHYKDFNLSPTNSQETRFDIVRKSQMLSWLPEPADIAYWVMDKYE